MFGNDTFVRVFGSTPPGDDEALIQVISAAVREGYAIVLDHPGEKRPMCVLSARDRNAADRAAQQTAASLGDPKFHMRKHDCGLHHALTVASLTGTPEAPAGDPSKVRAKVSAMVRRLTKACGGRQPNIGMELGRSRMLVVDVDTDAENIGFIRDYENQDPTFQHHIGSSGITVRSPGKQNVDGEWVHKNGGHYWFTIPDDVELPAGTGALKAESGWVAMWAGHQVLVPPSSRAEGAYELIGSPEEAPAWLIAKILHEAAARMDRITSRGPLPDGSSDIDQWSADLPWADLLTVDGWVETGLPDRCSCPIFTAPGAHASPKSATAHDVGCSQYDASPGHAPLHIWTDNPPEWLADAIRRTGSKTFSKLQYVAWRDHNGAVRGALNDLGMGSKDVEYPGFSGATPLETWNPVDVALAEKVQRESTGPMKTEASLTGSVSMDSSTATIGVPETDNRPESLFLQPGTGTTDNIEEDDAEEAVELTRAQIIRSLMIGSADLDSIEDPEYLIEGFLDQDTVSRMTGKSGHGKTFVMLDMSCSIALGKPWHGHRVNGGLVVYMVAEGTRGFKKRIRAWEAKYNRGEPIPDTGLLILPVPIQATGADWAPFRAALEALQPVLVVLDTQARVTVGVDENDAKEMGIFVDRMESIRHATKACVLAVHHLGLNGDHGRGSTAVIGALGSELRVKKTAKGFLTVETEKQKDGEEKEPLKFELAKMGDSVIPIPDGWTPVDPGADPMLAPAPPAKTAVGVTITSNARNRLAAIIHVVFGAGRGCTKAEALGIMASAEGHPLYGKASKTLRYQAWTELERDHVLIQQTTPGGKLSQRWKLSQDEADRLGLPPAGEPSADDTAAPDEGSEDESGTEPGPASEAAQAEPPAGEDQ